MKKKLGRKLPKNFDVHHLYHNRDNNDLKNLVAIPKDLHMKYHSFWMVSTLDINLIPKSPISQGGGYFAFTLKQLNAYAPVYMEVQNWIAHRDHLFFDMPRINNYDYER